MGLLCDRISNMIIGQKTKKKNIEYDMRSRQNVGRVMIESPPECVLAVPRVAFPNNESPSLPSLSLGLYY